MKASFQAESHAPRPAVSCQVSRTFVSRKTARADSTLHDEPEVCRIKQSELCSEDGEPCGEDGKLCGEGLDDMDEAFGEEIRREARAQAREIITRFLIWIAEGETLSQRGLRACVALYCTRPDLIGWRSLSQIGESGDRTEQAVQKLAKQFRATINLKT